MESGIVVRDSLNTWHQHFNGAGRESALRRRDQRAAVINLYEDVDFVFNTKYISRAASRRARLFHNKGEQKGPVLETNFVADAVNLPLIRPRARRRRRTHPLQHGARIDESHISQFRWERTRRTAMPARTSSC